MKKDPSSITVEEAVAKMVNMDYIPEGISLLEMVKAFSDEAESDYGKAILKKKMPKEQIASLEMRMESCRARHTLTQQLLDSLKYEINHPEDSLIELVDVSTGRQRVTFDSVWYWAADRFGIGITKLVADRKVVKVAKVANEHLKGVAWEDVTIKIWDKYKIGYLFKNKKGEQKEKRSSFRKIGLWDKGKEMPNKQGGILIGLSKKETFPAGKYRTGAETAAISKLRRALKNWVGLKENPFEDFDQHNAWVPRFKLIYDVDNADRRAKEKAEKTMVYLDDPKNKKMNPYHEGNE